MVVLVVFYGHIMEYADINGILVDIPSGVISYMAGKITIQQATFEAPPFWVSG